MILHFEVNGREYNTVMLADEMHLRFERLCCWLEKTIYRDVLMLNLDQ